MKFKTNMKCDGCIAVVKPALDQAVGAGNWKVDLSDPMKTLTIDFPLVDAGHIQKILDEVGYQVEEIV